MRRFCLLFLFALSTPGCSFISGFDNLSFEPVDTGSVDGSTPLPPDSSTEVDAGPDPMSDAGSDEDTGPDEDAAPDEDAFIPDAAVEDVGPTDGDSMPDTSTVDAEVPDAGPDAEIMDAGPEEDAFVSDTGPSDTGPTDSGPDTSTPDVGPRDAGPPDSGPMDAGPPSCAADPTQERCLLRVRFTNTPRINYFWFRWVLHTDGGPSMVDAWRAVPCRGGVRIINATTSECWYDWPPVPGTEVTFLPGYNADAAACNGVACLASPMTVSIYDGLGLTGDVTDVVESTAPEGIPSPVHAFRVTVPTP
jgi:hypothetical protein